MAKGISRHLLRALAALPVLFSTPQAALAEDAAPEGVVLIEEVERYGFEASRLGNAGRELMKATAVLIDGEPQAGNVHGAWSLRLRPDATADSCRVGDVEITLTSTLTLPDWTNVDRLDDDAQAEWERYIAALRTFMDGHVELNVAMVSAIRETVLAMPAEATCSALQASAGQAAAAVEADFDARRADYDRETRNGKALGAVLRKQYGRPD